MEDIVDLSHEQRSILICDTSKRTADYNRCPLPKDEIDLGLKCPTFREDTIFLEKFIHRKRFVNN